MDNLTRTILGNTTLVFVVTSQHFRLLEGNFRRLYSFGLIPSKVFLVVTDSQELRSETVRSWIPNVQTDITIRYLSDSEKEPHASIEHAEALNISLKELDSDSRYIWINDPDFYISGFEAMNQGISLVTSKGILTTPWSPKWIYKSRHVATPHFLFIDKHIFKNPFFISEPKMDSVPSKGVLNPNNRKPNFIIGIRLSYGKARKALGGKFDKVKKIRFIAKMKLRLKFLKTKDTHLSIPLHANGIHCEGPLSCASWHLLHLVRRDYDIKKPNYFIFGMRWEKLIPSNKSVWPRMRGFLVSKSKNADIDLLLNNGELLFVGKKVFGWHLRSIGSAGGDPRRVKYNAQYEKAKELLPTLDKLSEADIEVNLEEGYLF